MSSSTFMHVAFCYGRASILLCLRCDDPFMGDVIFSHNRPYGGMSMPLQRVTSLRRRAQANAAAASYWLRRVLDGGGCRD